MIGKPIESFDPEEDKHRASCWGDVDEQEEDVDDDLDVALSQDAEDAEYND